MSFSDLLKKNMAFVSTGPVGEVLPFQPNISDGPSDDWQEVNVVVLEGTDLTELTLSSIDRRGQHPFRCTIQKTEVPGVRKDRSRIMRNGYEYILKAVFAEDDSYWGCHFAR